jgi:4-azaleucine resistance transporter AzlC
VPPDETPRSSLRAGLRAGVPYAAAGFLLSATFGVLARDAGMPALAAIAMSAIVFAGSAQFASIAILAAGGGLGSAVGAAALMNSRFLPMGIALAPSLPGGPLKRAAQGQTVVDSSWALAARGDGTFDRWFLFGSTIPQYVTWTTGTIVGVFADDVIGNPRTLGLDALFPTFFLVLLIGELRRPGAPRAAVVGALVALALVPFTPAGVPILAASVAAFLGVRGRGKQPA